MSSGSPGPGSGDEGDGRITTIRNAGMVWRDIADPTEADMVILGREYHFHRLDLEEALSTRQLTKVEDRGEYTFISLRFPEGLGDGSIVSGEVSMFLGRGYLVTIRQSSFKRLSALVESLKKDEKKRGSLMSSPAYLAYSIIDRLVDGIYAVLDDVQASLDTIEAVVFNESKSSAEAINTTRREIAVLRRILYPLALYLPDLAKTQKFSDEDLSIYFSDLRHKVAKASRVTDEMKEMVEIYKDTDFVRSSNRTNWVLSILTIIFTLTIPATVVSSVYGMNVPLPGGAVTGPSGVFGLYTSMVFLFTAMIIPAGLMAWYFKRVGWI